MIPQPLWAQDPSFQNTPPSGVRCWQTLQGGLFPLVGGHLACTCLGPGVPGVPRGSGHHQAPSPQPVDSTGPHQALDRASLHPTVLHLGPRPWQVSGLLCQLPQLPTRPGTRTCTPTARTPPAQSTGTGHRAAPGVIHFPLSPPNSGAAMPAPNGLCGQPSLYFKAAIVNLQVKRPFQVKAHTAVYEVSKNSYFGIPNSGEAQIVLRCEDGDDGAYGTGRAAARRGGRLPAEQTGGQRCAL